MDSPLSKINIDLLPDELLLKFMLQIPDLKTLNNWCQTHHDKICDWRVTRCPSMNLSHGNVSFLS